MSAPAPPRPRRARERPRPYFAGYCDPDGTPISTEEARRRVVKCLVRWAERQDEDAEGDLGSAPRSSKSSFP